MFLPAPKGLRSAKILDERLEMLTTIPSVQPLREWASDLEQRADGRVVPRFDPAEAGVNARVLFVLEAPGPMANALSGNVRPGSGFISVDNNDATAANLWLARDAAALHDHFLAWNIVPWYLGPASVKPNAAELAEGSAALRELMQLLPVLEVVVLSGRFAQRGWRKFVDPSGRLPVSVVDTWHPGPQSMAQPGKRDALVADLRAVAGTLSRR